MLSPGHATDEDVQKRDEKEEHQVAADKTVLDSRNRQQRLGHKFGRKLHVPAQCENRKEEHLVKFHFEQQLESLAQRNLRGAHEVPRNQYETVDSRLAAPPEQQKQQRLCRRVIFKNHGHEAGIHHIVVRNNYEHRDDAEKFEIGGTGGGHG